VRRAWGLALALTLAACAPTASLPSRPVPADGTIAVRAEPVPEFAVGATQVAVCAAEPCGEWDYAGGLALSATDTSRFHGLSDMELASGQLTIVSDEGDLVTARLVTGSRAIPAGLSDVRIRPLVDLSGKSISGDKANADSEGLATLANGDRLISFELDHRIWLYPAGGGLPRPAPSPAGPFPPNGGMEALAADRSRGPDAYLVGGEDSGQLWFCRISTGCQEGPKLDMPGGFNLTAVTPLSGGRWAFLLRAFDVARGARAELQVRDKDMKVVDRLRLERPATVDNMEGVAAVEGSGGKVRFYLLSDDNFTSLQRTLLLAYDWTPPTPRTP
jgi:hypothetical protein